MDLKNGETVFRDETDTFKIIYENPQKGFVVYVNFSGNLGTPVFQCTTYKLSVDRVASFKDRLNA